MTRLALVIVVATLVAACAQLGTGYEVVKDRACGDPIDVRFARAKLFSHLTGQTVNLDCDGDGVPDPLGTWSPPK